MSHLEIVQDWINKEVLREDGVPSDPIPFESIEKVLNHAELSDEYIRMIYRVIGWMYKDASGIMALGLTDTYRGLSIDQVFNRVCKELDLPEPLDMAPSVTDSPEPANDSPRIHLIT